jgi:chromosome partitioning protein
LQTPKGGVGKSTLATNLAGCLARRGHRVMLGDIDAQQSSRSWLAHYVGQLGMPVLGFLRDTQNTVQLAAMGSTLWDVAPSRVERDIAQWQDLLRWIDE